MDAYAGGDGDGEPDGESKDDFVFVAAFELFSGRVERVELLVHFGGV